MRKPYVFCCLGFCAISKGLTEKPQIGYADFDRSLVEAEANGNFRKSGRRGGLQDSFSRSRDAKQTAISRRGIWGA